MLTGATGCGKTDLAARLFATAAVCPAEVVSADSMQVYRRMDIGTAKPSAELRAALPHHLIDICEPREQFNAGDFVRRAQAACVDIAARGKLPVVCGGTFFYLSNLINGIPQAPPSNALTRERLKTELAEAGADALMRELRERDPVSAARIHPHDEYRLLRALEVCRASGAPLSSFAQNGAPPAGLRFTVLVVERERAALYARINARTAAMFARGLPAEVAALAAEGLTPQAPALRAIGYREFFTCGEDGAWHLADAKRPADALCPPDALCPAGAFRPDDGGRGDSAGHGASVLECVQEAVAQNTRRYAKRQLTWLRALRTAERVALDESAATCERALQTIARHAGALYARLEAR